jgi:hypothetical protein
VARFVGRLQRGKALGDQVPLGFRNAGRRLEQADRVRGEPRTLDLEKVVEAVESRGETVGQHT